MNNEEFERKMSFIVEQQAQFAADIQQLQESQVQTDKVVNRLAKATLAGFNETLASFDNINVKISALVDSQIQTDQTLRNLIAVVDRYFKEGRNGG
jgi:hypothetical protein